MILNNITVVNHYIIILDENVDDYNERARKP